MRVLLTGGTGLLGKALLRSAAIDAPHIEILSPTRKELNLRESLSVRQYLQQYPVDVIIHAAARVGGIKANVSDPIGFMTDNIFISTHIIEEAYKAGVPHLINLGSSCMYPRDYHNPLVEEDILAAPLEPTNEGYAIAKIAASRLCAYISAQKGFAYKTIIPCNLYGPDDKFDLELGHLIAAAIMKVHLAHRNGDTQVEIWGDGTVRREFLYADDLARFIWKLIGDNPEQLKNLPPDMNVGLGHDLSVNEYYQAIAHVVKFKGQFKRNMDQPVGMTHKLMDISKAQSFGWAPETSLADGLEKAYAGFLRYFAN